MSLVFVFSEVCQMLQSNILYKATTDREMALD